MALQLSVTVRNARADSVETAVGTAPVIRIFDGSIPANCAAADAGTVLAEVTLPSDWMGAAASGAKAAAGTPWSDSSANATGTADYFRLYNSAISTCHAQGTVTATGGGGDLTVDNINFASGQAFSITAFGWTEPNA